MGRMVRGWILFLLLGLLLLLGCRGEPKETDAPMADDGSPILADVAQKYQITLPFYQLAFSRVPIAERAKFLGLEGRTLFLEKLAIEAVYYLEGVRMKFFSSKDFMRQRKIRMQQILNDEVRRITAEKLKIEDAEILAEYHRLVKDDRAIPSDLIKEELRLWLLSKAVDRTYEAKKTQLIQDWGVQFDYATYFSLNLNRPDDPQDRPKVNMPLATGKDYVYTVGQYLERVLLSSPEKLQEGFNNPQPRGVLMALFREDLIHRRYKLKQMLGRLVGEDLLTRWAQSEGLEATPEYTLRKELIDFGTLSFMTRENLVRQEIQANEKDIRAYYNRLTEAYEIKRKLYLGEGDLTLIELVAANEKLNLETFYRWMAAGGPPPFEAIKEELKAGAVKLKRDEAVRSMSKSLMKHRYITVYFQKQIEQNLR